MARIAKEKIPKIGFIGEKRENILEDLNFALRNHFDCYEISAEGVNFSLKPEIIKKVRKILENNNLSLILHIPYFLPIACLIPGISEAALKFAQKEIVLAAQLGARQITIHSSDKELPRINNAVIKNTETLIKNLKEMVKIGNKCGIKIGLENSWSSERLCRRAEDLLSVTNSVKGLGIVFDVGHANTLELNLLKYFSKIQNRIINIHIHDNDGKSDQHALIGEGNIDFEGLLKECKNMGYYGPFILEVFPHKNVLKCREKFLNLWDQI